MFPAPRLSRPKRGLRFPGCRVPARVHRRKSSPKARPPRTESTSLHLPAPLGISEAESRTFVLSREEATGVPSSRSRGRRRDFQGARRRGRGLRSPISTETHSGQDERGDQPERRQHPDEAPERRRDEPETAAAAEDLVAHERTAAGRAVFRRGRRALLRHARRIGRRPSRAVMAGSVGFFWILCRGPGNAARELARRPVPDGLGFARRASVSGGSSLVGDLRERRQSFRTALARQFELGLDEPRLENVDAPACPVGLLESLDREGARPGWVSGDRLHAGRCQQNGKPHGVLVEVLELCDGPSGFLNRPILLAEAEPGPASTARAAASSGGRC